MRKAFENVKKTSQRTVRLIAVTYTKSKQPCRSFLISFFHIFNCGKSKFHDQDTEYIHFEQTFFSNTCDLKYNQNNSSQL